MFAVDEDVARWNAQLERQLPDAARLDLLLQLNWHLRQRDPARALALAIEAAPLIDALPASRRMLPQARCMLVEAESRWLFGQLDAARQLAGEARDRGGESGGPHENGGADDTGASAACRADCH
ncbi:MAG: hypothetical protein JWP59_652, partial [Massilia sp.]|nr:hypothetical protein [Massilia sp.]